MLRESNWFFFSFPKSLSLITAHSKAEELQGCGVAMVGTVGVRGCVLQGKRVHAKF